MKCTPTVVDFKRKILLSMPMPYFFSKGKEKSINLFYISQTKLTLRIFEMPITAKRKQEEI